jgi:hypothetical protein
MVLGLMEVLNHSWLRNFREQPPFSDSGMQSISRINRGYIPSFGNDMDWQFLAPKIMCKMSEIIHGKRGQMYFFRIVTVSEREKALHPFYGIDKTIGRSAALSLSLLDGSKFLISIINQTYIIVWK